MGLEATEKETEGESITTSDDLLLRQQVRADRGQKLLLSLPEGELCFPPMKDILGEIFDMDDPRVFREVRISLAVGRIIVGDYFPKSKDVLIQLPLETSGYVERRIREVFG